MRWKALADLDYDLQWLFNNLGMTWNALAYLGLNLLLIHLNHFDFFQFRHWHLVTVVTSGKFCNLYVLWSLKFMRLQLPASYFNFGLCTVHIATMCNCFIFMYTPQSWFFATKMTIYFTITAAENKTSMENKTSIKNWKCIRVTFKSECTTPCNILGFSNPKEINLMVLQYI